MRSLIEDDRDPEAIELAPNAISLDLLQAVYRSNELPLHTRMRAAMAALKHEVPALLATAVVSEGSFAELLDKAIERSSNATLIDAQPIEQSNEIKPLPEPALPNPLLRMYSPRFRRRF
jgi:hypothetical protein